MILKKKKKDEPLLKAARAALQKIAGQALIQNAAKEKREEKELLNQLSFVLTQRVKEPPKTANVEEGKVGELSKMLPQQEVEKEKAPVVAPKSESKKENVELPQKMSRTNDIIDEDEKIDWQATVRVMQSVASIALAMLTDMEG